MPGTLPAPTASRPRKNVVVLRSNSKPGMASIVASASGTSGSSMNPNNNSSWWMPGPTGV